MRKHQIDAYWIPTSDYHQSEYISDYFKFREYMSGFTGSAGTLIIRQEEAVLFTDGRYFIQAEKQLQGSGITLMKMGEPGVPSVEEYLSELPEQSVLAYDGKVVNAKEIHSLQNQLQKKEIGFKSIELYDIWENRPELTFHPVFFLTEEESGESTQQKLERVRKEMKENGAAVHVLSSLDDIAWLFNMRGNDIAYNPVVFSYAVIFEDSACLFLNLKTVSEQDKKQLQQMRIQVYEYEEVYSYLSKIEDIVLLEEGKVNIAMYQALSHTKQVINHENPTTLMKAIKNPTEQKNLKETHQKDGIAMTKFMYWLKNRDKSKVLTEKSAADYLYRLRKSQEGFLELSFETISAYGKNAALMHYSVTEENDTKIEEKGFFLVDSGGQYQGGTTDVTRTFCMGEVTDEMKQHYTAVVTAMLNLANAKFLYGCKGTNLDILARGPLWNLELDYKCGTGHGVGYLLNVHEGPNSFRWKSIPGRTTECVFEEGMVTTDEPGVYIEGSHGIRIENELLCKKGITNEYGTYMYFEPLTLVPIDMEAIIPKQMEKREWEYLKQYQQFVYESLKDFLTEEEREWLSTYCITCFEASR